MPNHSSKPKRPRDVNQLAKFIVDLATAEPAPVEPEPRATAPIVPSSETAPPSDALREAARELGRRGGLKGGKARAAKLSPKQRSAIAKKAAAKRWGKTKDQDSSSDGGVSS